MLSRTPMSPADTPGPKKTILKISPQTDPFDLLYLTPLAGYWQTRAGPKSRTGRRRRWNCSARKLAGACAARDVVPMARRRAGGVARPLRRLEARAAGGHSDTRIDQNDSFRAIFLPRPVPTVFVHVRGSESQRSGHISRIRGFSRELDCLGAAARLVRQRRALRGSLHDASLDRCAIRAFVRRRSSSFFCLPLIA